MAADYLVLDLEWNQPVDPAAPQLQNLKTTLNGEIIQIGAVTLNAKGKITGTYTWLVRPTFLRQMHYHVRSLTGLTMQKVKKGILFPEANRQLAALCSPETLLLTCGPDDIHILRQNLLLHNLQDWVGEWCDLQRVYAQQMGATGQTSLQAAMEALHIQADRPAHDALNDAWFTALIAQKLDLKLGLEQYRDYVRLQEKKKLARAKRRQKHPLAGKTGTGYAHRGDAFQDPQLGRMRCPSCKHPLKQTSWFKLDKHRFVAMGVCPQHGRFIGQIRLTRSPQEEKWQGKRWIYAASPERLAQFEAVRQKKSARQRVKKGG